LARPAGKPVLGTGWRRRWDADVATVVLRVPDLARDVVAIDVRLLQKHVETPLVLSEGVAGDSKKRKA
jgi:hypothetical protein